MLSVTLMRRRNELFRDKLDKEGFDKSDEHPTT